jgi:FMN phosphatase YigB (HAD superfamily)
MVGDSVVKDVEGALAAGLGAVWINRNAHSRPPDQTEPVEISTLEELPEALAGLGLP